MKLEKPDIRFIWENPATFFRWDVLEQLIEEARFAPFIMKVMHQLDCVPDEAAADLRKVRTTMAKIKPRWQTVVEVLPLIQGMGFGHLAWALEASSKYTEADFKSLMSLGSIKAI